MKRIILILLVCVSASIIQAQEPQISNGYKGFVDIGYTAGVGDYKFGRIEINTTHGYQANPYIFIGAGIGCHLMQKCEFGNNDIPLDVRNSKTSIPIFADIRGTLSRKRVAPFIELKLGHFVSNNDGLYGNVAFGCKATVKGQCALSLAIGYTYEKLEFRTFNNFTNSSNMSYSRAARKLDCNGISIKLGCEF